MKVNVIAFTDKGSKLGELLAKELKGKLSLGTGENKVSFKEWTKTNWSDSDLLIFIGATGIAVRAVAPYLKSKAEDPAVLVLDDNAKHCISLLSGHIGRANEYAKEVASITGATPVITTATDVNEVFAIDSWATGKGYVIENPEKIKDISKKSLNGEEIDVDKEAVIGIYKVDTDKLILVPKCLSVGIGCRRDTKPKDLSDFYFAALDEMNIYHSAVESISTIDVKKDEEAILKLSSDNCLKLNIFTAEELNELEGDFTGSSFVKDTVGTDNVCERSAVLGNGGRLLLKKTAKDGMTIAIAVKE